MASLSKLRDKHFHLLAIIAADGDTLLFDLECQELNDAGLVNDDCGVLKLTPLGKATLRFVEQLEAA